MFHVKIYVVCDAQVVPLKITAPCSNQSLLGKANNAINQLTQEILTKIVLKINVEELIISLKNLTEDIQVFFDNRFSHYGRILRNEPAITRPTKIEVENVIYNAESYYKLLNAKVDSNILTLDKLRKAIDDLKAVNLLPTGRSNTFFTKKYFKEFFSVVPCIHAYDFYRGVQPVVTICSVKSLFNYNEALKDCLSRGLRLWKTQSVKNSFSIATLSHLSEITYNWERFWVNSDVINDEKCLTVKKNFYPTPYQFDESTVENQNCTTFKAGHICELAPTLGTDKPLWSAQ